MEIYNGYSITNKNLYNEFMKNYTIHYDKVRNAVPTVERVVFNNPATIVFWDDGSKTVVKTMKNDDFDPERGYLQAFYEKTMGNSKSRTQLNKYLQSLRIQYEKQEKK